MGTPRLFAASKRLGGFFRHLLGCYLTGTAMFLWFFAIFGLLQVGKGAIPLVGKVLLFLVPPLLRLPFGIGKRLLARPAVEVTGADPRPPVLLLRSFAVDNLQVNTMSLLWRFLFTRFMPWHYTTLEELLVRIFSHCGPVVAIGRPNETVPPLGAAREWLPIDKWQARVDDLLTRSRLVVFVIGDLQPGSGLAWEAQQILKRCDPRKVVFVQPPVSQDRLREHWMQLETLTENLLPPHEGDELAVRFAQDGTLTVLRTQETTFSIPRRWENDYLQVLTPIAHDFLSQPAPNWRRRAARVLLPSATGEVFNDTLLLGWLILVFGVIAYVTIGLTQAGHAVFAGMWLLLGWWLVGWIASRCGDIRPIIPIRNERWGVQAHSFRTFIAFGMLLQLAWVFLVVFRDDAMETRFADQQEPEHFQLPARLALDFSEAEMARISKSNGDVQLKAGRFGEALKEYQSSLEHLNSNPGTPQIELLLIHQDLGKVSSQLRDFAAARDAFQKMADIADKMAESDTSEQAQTNIAAAHRQLGDALRETGDFAGARQSGQKALEIRKKMAEAKPQDWMALYRVALAWESLAHLSLKENNLPASRDEYAECHRVCQRLVEGAPADSKTLEKRALESLALEKLAIAAAELGSIHRQLKEVDAARTMLQQAVETRQKLLDMSPVEAAQFALLVACEKLGDLNLQAGDLKGARAAYDRLGVIAEKMAAEQPANSQVQYNRSVFHERVGRVYGRDGDLANARLALQKSLEIRKKLAEAEPQNPMVQLRVARSWESLAQLSLKENNLPAARDAHAERHAVLHRLAEGAPADSEALQHLAVAAAELGSIHGQLKEFEAARRVLEQAVETRQKLLDLSPAEAAHFALLIACEKLGDLNLEAGDLQGARAAYLRQGVIAEKMAAEQPANSQVQYNLSVFYEKIGEVDARGGDLAKGRLDFQKCLEIRQALFAATPADTRFGRGIFYLHRYWGQIDFFDTRFAEAKIHFDEGIKVLQSVAQTAGQAAIEIDMQELHQLRANAEFGERMMMDIAEIQKLPLSSQPEWYRRRVTTFLNRTRQHPSELFLLLPEVERTLAAYQSVEGADAERLYITGWGYALFLAELENAKAREVAVDTFAEAQSEVAAAARARFQMASLGALKTALQMGYKHGKNFANDSNLTALRELPEFLELIKSAESQAATTDSP